MNLREKVYQMFILGTKGGMVEEALKAGLGGVIFFSDDIKSVSAIKKKIASLREKALYPPFFAIDQEGGRVERTENIHNGKRFLSQKFAFERGNNFLENQTNLLVKEIKNFGINLNFSPCIDVNTNPQNPIIGARAFSSNPEDVIKGAETVIEVHRKENVIPCVKHFPGHGDASVDSHFELPQIDLPLEEIEKTHIKPFAYAVDKKIPMVMVAHLHCTCFDKAKIPTSLSKNAIKYLRKTLGFDGVIITDDMVMKALGEKDCALRAIEAGCNLILYRNSDEKTIQIIESVFYSAQKDETLRKKIEDSVQKISALKHSFKLL